jgi:hypothetical protein
MSTVLSNVQGGCLCGAIRYRARAAPLSLASCHCAICRRASAAPFVAWATYRSADIVFVQGIPARYASSKRAERTFCARCGTPLTFQFVADPEHIDVTICSMDEPERFAPERHIWTRRRLPWVNLSDGLPQHPEEPD